MSPRAPRRSFLRTEQLEDRTVPTTWGIPWADADHVTLSFAPDGTQTLLGASSMNAELASTGTTAAWKSEILRAYQTWAANANINVGLVADGGQPLGALGAVQGDSRFGDVRIAAAPLSSGVVANTSPFSWIGSTFGGDMVLNSDQSFAIGNQSGKYDLYSVALHEAGHSFGLPDQTTDPSSVEYRTYQYATGLSAADIVNIQAMYGARTADAYDLASGGNNTLARASSMPKTSASQYAVTGDLTTASDVDYYKFSLGLLQGTLGTTIRLQASGLSLLTPKVTVYNSAGNVVGSAVSTDPLNNNLTIQIGSLLGGTYTVKVEKATSSFAVGSYVMAVDFGTLSGALNLVGGLLSPILDLHTNDLLGSATQITPETVSDDRFDATYRGSIEDSTDTDFFRVGTEKFAAGTRVNLNAMVWGLDANPLNPRLHVYDQSGLPVAFQILANDRGLFSVQIQNVVAGNDYYVQVAARDGSGTNRTGSYFLGVDFNELDAITYDTVAASSVVGSGTVANSLVLPEARLFEFSLAASSTQAGGVTMTVTDSTGNVVFRLAAVAGQVPVTTVQYLKAGSYTVRYSSTSGGSAPINYNLFMLTFCDPVGTMATTTSSSPSSSSTTTSSSSTTTSSSSSSSTTSSTSTSPPPPTYTYSSSSSSTTSYGYAF